MEVVHQVRRVIVLDDIEEIRQLVKENLLECGSIDIFSSTREELINLVQDGVSVPAPACIITDLYTGSDPLTILYKVEPVITGDASDESIRIDLRFFEIIIGLWPEAHVLVFSNFKESKHFTAKQKQFVLKRLRELGIKETQIISKDPLPITIKTVTRLAASKLQFPLLSKGRDNIAVLVVEDVDAERVTIVNRLAQEGISVYAAGNRKEGLKKLREFISTFNRVPDCIITDLYMPPEYEKAGTKMLTDIQEGDKVFKSIMKGLEDLDPLHKKLAEVPILIFSLYAISTKLDGSQVKAIEQKLDDLNIPKENRIMKTGRFSDRLERLVERLLEILESKAENKEI
jgi:CheY-like chemotaxis protein